MSGTKSIPALIPLPLANAVVRNSEPAESDIPRRLSAGAAWLHGYVNGPDQLDQWTPNPAPRSPMSGKRGHTHTGGLDGRPIFESLITEDSANENTAGGLTENGGVVVQSWTCEESTIPSTPADIAFPNGLRLPFGGPRPRWIPGCDPVQGAYVRLGWRIVLNVVVSTDLESNDTLQILIVNRTTGGFVSYDLDGIDATGIQRIGASVDAHRIPTLPGAWNLFDIDGKLTVVETAGNAARTLSVQLLQFEAGVYET